MSKILIMSVCVMMLLMGSCKTAPNPCFVVLTPADSIHVGYIIRFNASCTSDASKYYWDFGNGQTASNTLAQTTYDSAGSYLIALIVGGNGKSGSVTKAIVVNP